MEEHLLVVKMESKYRFVIGGFFLLFILGFTIAGDLGTFNTSKDIPNDDVDVILEKYNQTIGNEINPTVSEAECYDGVCRINYRQQGLVNTYMEIQELDENNKTKSNAVLRSEADDKFELFIMELANTTRERNARNPTIKDTAGSLDIK